MAKTITAKRTRSNTVWLTFNYPYQVYTGMGYYTIEKQRFAIEMVAEVFAKNSWLRTIAETSINHCGKFSEDTIVFDLDGFVVKNEELLNKSKELKRFVNILRAGISMGKERTVKIY